MRRAPASRPDCDARPTCPVSGASTGRTGRSSRGTHRSLSPRSPRPAGNPMHGKELNSRRPPSRSSSAADRPAPPPPAVERPPRNACRAGTTAARLPSRRMGRASPVTRALGSLRNPPVALAAPSPSVAPFAPAPPPPAPTTIPQPESAAPPVPAPLLMICPAAEDNPPGTGPPPSAEAPGGNPADFGLARSGGGSCRPCRGPRGRSSREDRGGVGDAGDRPPPRISETSAYDQSPSPGARPGRFSSDHRTAGACRRRGPDYDAYDEFVRRAGERALADAVPRRRSNRTPPSPSGRHIPKPRSLRNSEQSRSRAHRRHPRRARILPSSAPGLLERPDFPLSAEPAATSEPELAEIEPSPLLRPSQSLLMLSLSPLPRPSQIVLAAEPGLHFPQPSAAEGAAWPIGERRSFAAQARKPLPAALQAVVAAEVSKARSRARRHRRRLATRQPQGPAPALLGAAPQAASKAWHRHGQEARRHPPLHASAIAHRRALRRGSRSGCRHRLLQGPHSARAHDRRPGAAGGERRRA